MFLDNTVTPTVTGSSIQSLLFMQPTTFEECNADATTSLFRTSNGFKARDIKKRSLVTLLTKTSRKANYKGGQGVSGVSTESEAKVKKEHQKRVKHMKNLKKKKRDDECA